MAESYALSDAVSSTMDLAPDERGSLTISTTAMEHLAEAAAKSVSGTVAHTSVLRKLSGTAYPRAQVTVRGERAWITLDVAATWPCAASRIAAEVRDRVRREAARLSGLQIESLDVTLHVVDVEQSAQRRVQ